MDFLSVWFWICIVLMDPFPSRQIYFHIIYLLLMQRRHLPVLCGHLNLLRTTGFGFLKSFRTTSSSFPLEKKGIEEAWISVISKTSNFLKFQNPKPKEPEVWFCESTGSFIGF